MELSDEEQQVNNFRSKSILAWSGQTEDYKIGIFCFSTHSSEDYVIHCLLWLVIRMTKFGVTYLPADC